MYRVFIESIFVAVLNVLIGFPISYAIMYYQNPNFNFDFKMSFILNLFLLGMLTHIISEFSGINKRYCLEEYQCKA